MCGYKPPPDPSSMIKGEGIFCRHSGNVRGTRRPCSSRHETCRPFLLPRGAQSDDTVWGGMRDVWSQLPAREVRIDQGSGRIMRVFTRTGWQAEVGNERASVNSYHMRSAMSRLIIGSFRIVQNSNFFFRWNKQGSKQPENARQCYKIVQETPPNSLNAVVTPHVVLAVAC